MNKNKLEHKLTNSLLSPLEAQRLAMNLQMIERARKKQEKQPLWLTLLIIIAYLGYLGLGLLYIVLY